jgi:hypothetical protein
MTQTPDWARRHALPPAWGLAHVPVHSLFGHGDQTMVTVPERISTGSPQRSGNPISASCVRDLAVDPLRVYRSAPLTVHESSAPSTHKTAKKEGGDQFQVERLELQPAYFPIFCDYIFF